MMQNITIQAGVPVPINEAGDFFRMLAATDPMDLRFYRNGKEVAEALQVGAGYAEQFGEGFDRLVIESATTQNIQFTVRLGNRVFFDAPPTGNVSVVNVRGAVTQAQKTVTNASAEMIAANTARRFLLIQNKSASGTLYLNLSGVAATTANGLQIGPGDSLSLENFVPTGAVHAIGDIASNPDVVVVEG